MPPADGAELHKLSEGVVAEQPLHPMVPEFVMPQEFGAEVQELPYPAGFAGVVAEQVPLQPMVPELVWPHAFGAEVQEVPYPGGSGGVEPEQVPSH